MSEPFLAVPRCASNSGTGAAVAQVTRQMAAMPRFWRSPCRSMRSSACALVFAGPQVVPVLCFLARRRRASMLREGDAQRRRSCLELGSIIASHRHRCRVSDPSCALVPSIHRTDQPWKPSTQPLGRPILFILLKLQYLIQHLLRHTQRLINRSLRQRQTRRGRAM